MKNELTSTDGEETVTLTDDTDFACYRLPGETHYTLVAEAGAATLLPDDTPLEGKKGFLIAPFLYATAAPSGLPVLLIRPHACIQAAVPETADIIPLAASCDENRERTAYHHSFMRAYRHFSTSGCCKFVLSRSHRLRLQEALRIDELLPLFFKACRLYPRSYVALWHTQAGGTWLTATPETLLRRDACGWHTMALAGTMDGSDPRSATPDGWSAKNREEQAYVSRYIAERLRPLARTWQASATRPTDAAGMRHLRTDFTFTTADNVRLRTLLEALHPTPAVCGWPAGEALAAILDAEPHARRYYAGFSGPLAMGNATAFYVSLRCMELTAEAALLYAGGGILKESREEDEWQETCRKMQPMLRLFSS